MNPFIPNDLFYPLHIGYQWIYNNSNVETIVDTATFNGNLYYNIESSIIQPDFWIRQNDNAVCFIDTNDNSEHILFDFSAKPGNSWDMPDGYGCTVGDKIQLISDSETITTPTGKFYNCYHFYHISHCMDGGLRHTWFAKGVGIVKYIYDSWFGIRESLLTSYSFVNPVSN